MSEGLDFVGEIRDPVHGLIHLTDIEFKIIDSAAFQRLRNIKQLALACLGFHGAFHTRFDHCIGTMHIASKVVEHLANSKERELDAETHQTLRLAALLHDIGHGPFSHLSENLLDYYNQDVKKTQNIEEIHEEISRRIITENKELIRILGKGRSRDISRLLKTDGLNQDYKHDIVSGSMDSDKMDYLLRDSYYAGVKYGLFDLERMINVLTLIEENRQSRLAVKLEGIQTVEQYVLAKYFIANQVYQHKIRHITDIMIIEGIKSSISEGNRELKKLYRYSNSAQYIDKYLAFDDNRTFNSVLNNSKASTLGFKYYDMLKKRNLLKRLYDRKFEEIVSESTETAEKLEKIKHGDCDELKNEISRNLKISSDFTHVVVYSLKSPLIQKSFSIDEESIRVKKAPQITTVLDQESFLYGGIMQNAKKHFISVFGLPNKQLSPNDYQKAENKIQRILLNYFGG